MLHEAVKSIHSDQVGYALRAVGGEHLQGGLDMFSRALHQSPDGLPCADWVAFRDLFQHLR